MERDGVAVGKAVVDGVVDFPFEILGILNAEDFICAVLALLPGEG